MEGRFGSVKVVDLTDRRVQLWKAPSVRDKGSGVAAKAYARRRAIMNVAVGGSSTWS